MKKVFDAHKDVQVLYVVDGVPFLEKKHALNFAKGDESKVKEAKRGVEKDAVAKAAKAEKDAAAKAAKAEKDAAAKAAKAEKDASGNAG